jgi:Rad3-related DNA helicase
MRPSDLGLPQKFKDFWPGQWEAIQGFTDSQAFAYLLDSPPGSGKTLLAAATQKVIRQPVVVLTSTKQLQAQMVADFPDRTRILMGRNNYPCALHPDEFPLVTAADCPPDGCKKSGECAYQDAKQAAARSDIAVLNYQFFLLESDLAGSFSGRILICDECDQLESHLSNFISVVITREQIEDYGLPWPKHKNEFDSWLEWGKEAYPLVEKQYRELSSEFTLEGDAAELNVPLIRQLKKVERFKGQLDSFVHDVTQNWVFYPGTSKWEFKPVWVRKYAQRALWRHARRVFCMSGTILSGELFARDIGLDPEDITYRRLPCHFPVKNRPIIYRPVANVVYSRQAEELPKLAAGVQRVLEEHPDQKILVHSTSYPLRQFLMSHLESDRLITHESGNRELQLNVFKASRRPLVMVSPSMDRGVSLNDDLCRVVIIAKVPYPSLADPQVKRRMATANGDGQRWYSTQTVSTIIQMAMRGMRSDDDWCTTVILDRQFESVYKRNILLFPQYFKDALRWEV